MVKTSCVVAALVVALASSTSATYYVPKQRQLQIQERAEALNRKVEIKLDHLAGVKQEITIAPVVQKKPNGTKRNRRHEDEGCPGLDYSTYVDAIEKTAHEFTGAGGLTIQWVGTKEADDMLVTTDMSASSSNMWMSQDEGNTWSQPQDDAKVLAAFYSAVKDSNDHFWAFGIPEGDGKELYVSSDNARSFSKTTVRGQGAPFKEIFVCPTSARMFLAIDVNHFGFYCTAADGGDVSCVKLTKEVDGASEKVIDLLWSVTGKSEGQDIVFMMTTFDLSASKDQHTFHRLNIENPEERTSLYNRDHLEQIGQYVFLTTPPDNTSLFETTLYVSTDDAVTFDKAQFPFAGRSNHFAVVDASEDFVLVAVDHNRTRVEGNVMVEVDEVQYMAKRALFSEVLPIDGVTANLYFPIDNDQGCNDKEDPKIEGKILVLRRGVCKFVEKAAYAETQKATGLIIVNDGDLWMPYMQAASGAAYPVLPVVMVNKTSGEYLITKATNGDISAYISENDTSEKALYQTSNLYMSDQSGIHFSVSLKNVAFKVASNLMEQSYVDVFKIESMPGAFIANYLNGYNIYGQKLTKTVISYNKGVNWYTVKAPSDRGCRESDGCSISIVLESENTLGTPMPLSSKYAVGLVLANAYEGNSNNPYTIVSRDGGFSWHQLVDETDAQETQYGAHDYRILDHGSVILFTEFRKNTNKVLISFDEAQNGEVVEFVFLEDTTTDVTIQGVITEPGAASTRAFIYYWTVADLSTGTYSTWHGTTLSFDKVLVNVCAVGIDTESFSAPDGVKTGGCVLGAKTTYTRRKPCNICLNKDAVNRKPVKDPCECEGGDFRCAPAFHRAEFLDADAKKTECISDVDAPQPECGSGGTKSLYKYELIAGDVCAHQDNAGKYVQKSDVPCHASTSVLEEVGKGIGYLLGFGVLSVLILAMVFTFSKSARDVAISTFGTEGTVGKFLSRFACFRTTPSHVYSILADESQNLTEDASQIYDGVSEDEDEDDEDDLLFDLDDTQKEGATTSDDNRGLPIY